MNDGLRIGFVSAAAGVSRDTIRYYERSGLLRKPARSESGYRLFTQQDVGRLRDVKQAQALGLTLDQIRGLLAPHPDGTVRCRQVHDVLSANLRLIDDRIRQLVSFRTSLSKRLARCKRQLSTSADPSCLLLRTGNGKKHAGSVA